MSGLAPCRCGYPGAGCYCYEERRAEADVAERGVPVSDPLQPSDEWTARMDQMRAAARELADSFETMVAELVARGWTVEQGRAIIVAAITSGRSS